MGKLAIDDLLHSIVSFWIGDTIGILMLTPLLLLLRQRYRSDVASSAPQRRSSDQESAPVSSPTHLLVDFSLVWVFLVVAYRLPEWLVDFASNIHWYLAFLPMIWVSFRHGLSGSIAGVLAITTGAAWLTYLPVQSARFHELQVFIVFLALTALLMGSVVSAMRSTEGALKLRNAELERYVYAVSHDLKSPLVTIRGFLGLLEQDVAEGAADRMKDDVQRIHAAADKMGRVLDDLLDLSQAGRVIGPTVEVPLGELVSEALEQVAGTITKRGVEVEVSSRLPVVHGDRSRLLEVFRNLIENAVNFAGDQNAPRLEIGARDGSEPVIYVRDNGIGIDRRYHERIFRLFEKLDPLDAERTGVGLSLVRRIVEMHGGRVWVESEGRGRGATFCLTLPKTGTAIKAGLR